MKKKRTGFVSSELAKEVLDRANNRCENCGIYRCDIFPKRHEIHHIVGRKVDATPENLIYLCWECHKGTSGVHGRDGAKLNKKLKMELQEKYFAKGYNEIEVRKMMNGKITI